MKSLFTFLFLLITIIANAQLSDVITGLNGPKGLFLDGTKLYFGEIIGDRISKFETSDNAPMATEIVAGLEFSAPNDILIHDGQLYYVDAGNKIMRFYLAVPSPTPVEVNTGIDDPFCMLLIGEELYISSATSGKISKIIITDLIHFPVEVVSGLDSPTRMAIRGNDLYIAEYSSGEISKIDITAPNPFPTVVAFGLTTPYDLAFSGDDLYISEFDANRISKINVEQLPITVEEVTSAVTKPNNLMFVDNDLYISEYGENKISVYRDMVNDALIVPKNNNKLKVHPNPSSDYISIQHCVPNSRLMITGIEGRIWKNVIINENEWIDVKDLPVGTYSLVLEGQGNVLFIKH